jgi:hypothetical protein
MKSKENRDEKRNIDLEINDWVGEHAAVERNVVRDERSG